MTGAGNDFILMDARRHPSLLHVPFVPKVCDRKFGVGADGVLLLTRSKKADVGMRIFNADGSEAEMCGNGARCLALHHFLRSNKKKFSIETGAGILQARVAGPASVTLRMTDPADIRLGQKVRLGHETVDVAFINTGVPHAVVEVEDLEGVPVVRLGRSIRRHAIFKPAGTNVDFIRVHDRQRIDIRTYERGVEDETLACGTGSVAGAIASALNHPLEGLEAADARPMRHKIRVQTRSGEILTVAFAVSRHRVTDVWLEGKAEVVFSGVFFV
jgi:diaminopimelate epimerase